MNNQNDAEGDDIFVEDLTITLGKPVQLGSETYTEIRLREPTADEWVQAAKVANGAESNVKLVALVSGLPEPVVRKIGLRDFLKAVRHTEFFLV